MTNEKIVKIYTDGACSGNPGPGGYCAVLCYNEHEKTLTGGEKETTNNRMELMAVIEGLQALKESCNVTVYSDSRYIVDSITNGWAEKWRKNNWIKSDKKKALNPDLWDKLLNLTKEHNIDFIWIKGHSGHKYNEMCDKLATAMSDKYKEMDND